MNLQDLQNNLEIFSQMFFPEIMESIDISVQKNMIIIISQLDT